MPDHVAVASSVYNLAGNPAGRPDYLKSLVVSGVIRGDGASVGPAVVSGYGTSTAHRVSTFIEWARNDSDFSTYIGITSGTLPGTAELDLGLISGAIPVDGGEHVVRVESATCGLGSMGISSWVDAYMMAREDWRLGYTYKYDPSTKTVTATVYHHPGGGAPPVEEKVVFQLSQMRARALYLYVKYVRSDDRYCWLIYRQGSGNTVLDAQLSSVNAVLLGSFYPPIPFRYENKDVAPDSPDPVLAAAYPACKRAFKRAFGASFDDVQEKILQNDSIGDIDYVYAVLSVTLNTPKASSRRYVYRFFQYLMGATSGFSEDGESRWLADWDSGRSRPGPPWQYLRVESVKPGSVSYRTDIKWAFIHENTGTGRLRPGAQAGDTWFEDAGDPLFHYPPDAGDGFNQRVVMCWQETSSKWRRLTLTGLQYNNYVYVTKSTMVTAREALATEGRDSEFLVPLHEGIFEAMPLVDQLEVGPDCAFLVFNCYEVDKEEWYETDEFKIIAVVVVVAASIATALFTGGGSLGAGGAAVAGLLAGAGISTTAAIIIVAAAEAIAGLVVSMLITAGATALLGDEWGPIVGSIISVILTLGMSAGSLANLLDSLTKPDVWLSLALATGNGVASYMGAESRRVAEDSAKLLEQYGRQSAEVQRLFRELAGPQGEIAISVINEYISEATERPSDFLRRTLATGSDIVAITLDQVGDFAKNNLQLVLP